jgi:hypothetical protein
LENWRRKNMSFYPKKEIYKKGFGRFSIGRRLGDERGQNWRERVEFH